MSRGEYTHTYKSSHIKLLRGEAAGKKSLRAQTGHDLVLSNLNDDQQQQTKR